MKCDGEELWHISNLFVVVNFRSLAFRGRRLSHGIVLMAACFQPMEKTPERHVGHAISRTGPSGGVSLTGGVGDLRTGLTPFMNGACLSGQVAERLKAAVC